MHLHPAPPRQLCFGGNQEHFPGLAEEIMVQTPWALSGSAWKWLHVWFYHILERGCWVGHSLRVSASSLVPCLPCLSCGAGCGCEVEAVQPSSLLCLNTRLAHNALCILSQLLARQKTHDLCSWPGWAGRWGRDVQQWSPPLILMDSGHTEVNSHPHGLNRGH